MTDITDITYYEYEYYYYYSAIVPPYLFHFKGTPQHPLPDRDINWGGPESISPIHTPPRPRLHYRQIIK